jgi:hypothetical protein
MKPDDQQKVADLHQRIRQAQWDLLAMQQSGADQERIAKQQKSIAGLRERLQKLMAATCPAGCPRLSHAGAGPLPGSVGVGCPWGNQPGGNCPRGSGLGRCLGGGWACGRGPGLGMGMWGGVCPWSLPLASPPPAAPKAP